MRTHRGRAFWRAGRTLALTAAFSLPLAPHLGAQGRGEAQRPGARTPRAAAIKDLTGYWESIVTEFWRYRMMVPDKSDYVNIPLNAEGRKVADAWDLAKDQAGDDQCKAYGAAGIMQVPGRLHIYWQDDSTLRVDADSGTQTRLLHFGGSAPAGKAPEWQGFSVAAWEGNLSDSQRSGGGGPVLPREAAGAQGALATSPTEIGGMPPGYLRVTTSQMRPGYLRKNGIPYSANATMEEYFDRFSDPYSGETWLAVTTVVTDPQYLMEPYITHAHFKKLPDVSGWDPTPCRADQPR